MSITIKAIDAPLGAEIDGVDLSVDPDDATFNAIKKALDDRSVAVIHGDKKIGPERLVHFAKRFGNLLIHPQVKVLVPNFPELMIVSNVVENGRNIGSKDAGYIWHTDGSYLNHPDMYTFLYALEVPQENGKTLGNTLFSSTAAVYDALSESMKGRVANLKAIHSFSHHSKVRAQQKNGTKVELTKELLTKSPDRAQPVVRTHPVTGRKALYVSEGHSTQIEGMEGDEGDALLRELLEHVVRPEFIYSHNWRVGDLVIWDNSATVHRATFDYPLTQRRLMYRTATEGTTPF